jgi:hypothetical protein
VWAAKKAARRVLKSMEIPAMKKRYTIICLGLMLLLLSYGCSSGPSVDDILKDPESKLGQEVVAVGMAETKSNLASLGMFRLYNGQKYIWVTLTESVSMPPQATQVRVTGTLYQKNFATLGMTYFIEAKKISLE